MKISNSFFHDEFLSAIKNFVSEYFLHMNYNERCVSTPRIGFQLISKLVVFVCGFSLVAKHYVLTLITHLSK